jgi:hypothetical protein
MPRAIDVMDDIVVTAVGTLLSVLVPSPTWPEALEPQQYKLPTETMAQV